MTILQSLAGYYDRMAARKEAEAPGFSREKISFVIVLAPDGGVVDVVDIRDTSGKKPVAVQRDVPAGPKRTVGIIPCLLWDKSAYSLGVTAGEGKRTAQEHAAFLNLHAELLANTDDEGLAALRRFLETWSPAQFVAPMFKPDMLDTNIVFRLDGDAHFIHDRPAALPLVEARGIGGLSAFCLVSGADVPMATLHPSIKGVDGAQTAGASLVSFNARAYESYGLEQGANAPTGKALTFRYGAALNRLLDRGGKSRFRIGDTTTVFWADTNASGEEIDAAIAEDCMAAMFGTADRDTDYDLQEAAKLRTALEPLSNGQAVETGRGELNLRTRIHILGLAPNAARLSVRFWLTEDLGDLARHLKRHADDCRIEPLPRHWGAGPSINRLLVQTTAAQEKWDNIPPLLAGEMARAVLGGGRYPRTLLGTAIMRLRAGDDPGGGWHAAAIRAVLQRNDKGAPMSLDKDVQNPAYRLGRLFAVLEEAQERAIVGANATIRDRYFGAAMATPASVFPLLLRGVQNHVSKLRKDNTTTGHATNIERRISEIVTGLSDELPRSLRLEEQGRFAIGYYHQRAVRFAKKDAAGTTEEGTPHE